MQNIKNNDLASIWLGKNNNASKELLMRSLLSKIMEKDVFLANEKYIKTKISRFCNNITERWQKAHRQLTLFKIQNSDWLSTDILIESEKLRPASKITLEEAPLPSTSGGRPRLSFSNKSDRSKCRQVSQLSNDQNY